MGGQRGQKVSVIVFVWTDSIHGHASLKIEGYPAADDKDNYATYVSFYPDPGRISREDIENKGLGGVAGTPTTMSQNSYRDTANRRRIPSFASAPIEGLNEDSMVDYWRKFRADNPNWSLWKNSCADVVFQVLEAGGASDKSLIAKVMIVEVKIGLIIVHPIDCIALAKALGG
jgi:hypothetical protein